TVKVNGFALGSLVAKETVPPRRPAWAEFNATTKWVVWPGARVWMRKDRCRVKPGGSPISSPSHSGDVPRFLTVKVLATTVATGAAPKSTPPVSRTPLEPGTPAVPTCTWILGALRAETLPPNQTTKARDTYRTMISLLSPSRLESDSR